MAIFAWLVLKGFFKKLKQTKLSICDLILKQIHNYTLLTLLGKPKSKIKQNITWHWKRFEFSDST